MKRMAAMAWFLALILLSAPATAGAARKSKRKIVNRETAQIREAEKDLRESLNAVRQTCGLPKLKVEVDWESFRGELKESHPMRTAAGLCETVVDGLKAWCAEREPKGALAKQVGVLKCGYRRDAIRFQAEKTAKTISAYYSWETANVAEEMSAWLKKSFE
jgi:hypothetical protein